MKTARLQAVDTACAFQPTTDRASLWLTGQYDDALRTLRAAVLGRQGLLVLVGEGGTGKTVLAHALALRVREDAVVVGRLLYPILEGMDLLAAVAEAFGLPTDFKDRDGFVEQLQGFVAETAAAGRRVLLVVDEAQRLNNELLIELGRLPYDRGAGEPAALSVLLVGQRGVLDALRGAGVEPEVLCHLRPLTREQTAEYIAYRLRTAGYRGRLFTASALRKLWVVSEGIPRAANALSIEAIAHLRQMGGRRAVTAGMVDRPARVREAVAEPPAPRVVEGTTPRVVEGPVPVVPARRPARPRRRLAWLAAAGVVGLSLGAAWGVTRSERAPWSPAPPEVTTESAAVHQTPGVDAGTPPSASVAAPGVVAADDAARADRSATVVKGQTDPASSSTPAAKPGPPRRSATVATPQMPDDGAEAIDWLLKHRSAGNPR
jgi:type II secretory pathway predicted ATPase ExeA